MTLPRDLYAVLGVRPGAPDEVIGAARKALLFKYHPDRFRGDPGEAAKRSTEINAAFEILGDPERRARYDDERAVLDAPQVERPSSQAPPYQSYAWKLGAQKTPAADPGDLDPWAPKPRRATPSWLTLLTILGFVLVGAAVALGLQRPGAHTLTGPAAAPPAAAKAETPSALVAHAARRAASPAAQAMDAMQVADFRAHIGAATRDAAAEDCQDASVEANNAAAVLRRSGPARLHGSPANGSLVQALSAEEAQAGEAVRACSARQKLAYGVPLPGGDATDQRAAAHAVEEAVKTLLAVARTGDCESARSLLSRITRELDQAPDLLSARMEGRSLGHAYALAQAAANTCVATPPG